MVNRHETNTIWEICFFQVFQANPKSAQIIATSHDLTPNGGLVREIPFFQGNPGW